MSNARAPPREITYLSEAAHLLRQTAPETAARLMRIRNELLLRAPSASSAVSRPLSDVQRQSVCTACGNILVPGLDGDQLRISPAGPAYRRHKHRAAMIASRISAMDNTPLRKDDEVLQWGVTKILVCGRCSSTTKIRIPAPPRIARARKDKSSIAPQSSSSSLPATTTARPTATLADATDAKQSANAASKQRKKTRKAGLQALLAGQKGLSQPKSFTLADFGR